MDPVSITLIVGAVKTVTTTAKAAFHVGQRVHRKKVDALIHIESYRQREAERLEGRPKNVTNHPLHPHHPLVFDEGPTRFSCAACVQDGTGSHYSCKSCDFNLHRACAISDDMLTDLLGEETKVVEFIHDHPLSLISELSRHTCNFCKNRRKAKYKYNCEQCKKDFDLMCVNHPARLLSFLHPQHELMLKTKHHFKTCSVCLLDRNDSNNKVYSCEECKFYAHPLCAMRNQYIQHSLHDDHFMVFVAVPKDKTVTCTGCNKKCRNWCYLCPFCEGVYFHPQCIGSATSSSTGQLAVELTALANSTLGEVAFEVNIVEVTEALFDVGEAIAHAVL